MIGISGLNKFFNRGKQNELHVLNNITLDLPDKGMVAIFGRSGCGKTTLLNVIGGLDGYHSGNVHINGEKIGVNNDVVRNKYIGYIFQNYNLNKDVTCYDNIADALRLLGMKDGEEMDTRVNAALKNVGMDKFAKRLPDTLSGGQQQRIAIARAIVKNPRIILADEPTGNLDEANTIMVMDLLKKISRDHLVILVTHEANLVDFYCDTVVELSDGRIVSVRNNTDANGYAAKDKNAIYLGELEKSEITVENAEIEYYGERTDSPIKLKIVNSGGKIYLKIDSPDISIIDNYSETKLLEGVYEQKADENTVSADIDMTDLPPLSGHHHGRLFGFFSSIKSGFNYNFREGKASKRGRKALRRVMFLFAAVLVLMTSIFGTAIGNIVNVRETYNHNVFYVYTPDIDVSSKINSALKKGENGVDSVYLNYGYPSIYNNVRFKQGFFETFNTGYFDSGFTVSAVYLKASLARELPVAVGKSKDLLPEEIVITTAVADELLDNSTLGYITEYSDLLGLVSAEKSQGRNYYRIAGIVKSDEKSIYIDDLELARAAMTSTPLCVDLGSDRQINVEKGKTVFVYRYGDISFVMPKEGETVLLNGVPLEISEIMTVHSSYDSWMDQEYPELCSSEKYMQSIYQELYPDSSPMNDPEYYDRMFDINNTNYFNWRELYYSNLGEFVRQFPLAYGGDFYSWLYIEKGFEDAKWFFLGGDAEYYSALKYKELNGEYPRQSEMQNVEWIDHNVDLSYKYSSYEKEYYNSGMANGYSTGVKYLVSEDDYISVSDVVGYTTYSALQSGYTIEDEPTEVEIDKNGEKIKISNVVEYKINYMYTVIHSNSPKLTDEWLRNEFSDIETESEYMIALITPDAVFDELMLDYSEGAIAALVSLGATVVLMSVCMYFIMRSSLMARVKEIGIYRAIGVSRKNLIYKFTVEAAVLTTLTVFIGFAVMSAFVSFCINSSSLFETIFYYPWWMALGLLVLIYALCLFCGVLPLMLLLRKTPSEILSKYDI